MSKRPSCPPPVVLLSWERWAAMESQALRQAAVALVRLMPMRGSLSSPPPPILGRMLLQAMARLAMYLDRSPQASLHLLAAANLALRGVVLPIVSAAAVHSQYFPIMPVFQDVSPLLA